MPTSPTTIPADAFVCGCEEWMRPACKQFKEYKGTGFCVLHYPGKEKGKDFAHALNEKLKKKDFDFRGVHFVGECSFNKVVFDANASFVKAVFNDEAMFFGTVFIGYADFRRAEFRRGLDFRRATFKVESNFRRTIFGTKPESTAKHDSGSSTSASQSDATYDFSFTTFEAHTSFFSAEFDSVNFIASTFRKEADFRLAAFKERVNLSVATFDGNIEFRGEEGRLIFSDSSSLSLWFARINTPEGLSFHTVTLRPYWFVNVDACKCEFINTTWYWQSTRQEINTLRESVKEFRFRNVDDLSTQRLLAIACRNLATNAEENHRYEEASKFRYMAMDARRLESWRSWRDFTSWMLGWLYWLASGYGERVWRAFVVLLGVLLLFAALYTRVGFVRWESRISSEREAAAASRDEVGEPLRWQRALIYSLGVMTLQKPEPRPATNTAQGLVMLETILGPVQAALLALAIRRKFMR